VILEKISTLEEEIVKEIEELKKETKDV